MPIANSLLPNLLSLNEIERTTARVPALSWFRVRASREDSVSGRAIISKNPLIELYLPLYYEAPIINSDNLDYLRLVGQVYARA